MASGPQELPAGTTYPAGNEPSELAAGASSSRPSHRFSELPADAARVAELESPPNSSTIQQAEFSTDLAKQANRGQGLGVTTEEAPRNN